MLHIRVYGRTVPAPTLETALTAQFGELSLSQGFYKDDAPLSPEVVGSDLILCFLDRPAEAPDGEQGELDDDAHSFIGRTISHHGSWSYLPILVVGEPTDAKKQQAFFRLGATRYLPPNLGDDKVAEHARKVVGHSWWHVESRSALPAFLVGKEGLIIRANGVARRRFGDDLEGKFYTMAVEQSSTAWADHPIAQCLLGEGQPLGADRKFSRADGQEERYYLHCRPMHGSRARAKFAAVLVLEMSRWEKLVAAPVRLGGATSLEDLYQRIVCLGRELGFARVRLYEAVNEGKALKGRASLGYDEAKRGWFKETFEIEIAKDEPSRDTISGDTRVPRLWIERGNNVGAMAGPGADTDIKRYFYHPPNFAEDLCKENVRRWIEAPIWLPAGSAGQPERLWGKFSIDQGAGSEQLDERDIGDVALYCRLVGEAIVAFFRRQMQRTIETMVDQISGQLVAGPHTGELLPVIISPLLGLCSQLTGAEVVLYRRHDEKSPNPLRLVGEPVFSPPELKDRFEVPRDIYRSDSLAELFPFLDKRNPQRSPYIVEDAAEKVQRLWAAPVEPLSDKQRNYCDAIRSELHVPLWIGQDVVGAIIAVSHREKAFSKQEEQVTLRLTKLLSVWVELAQRHDGQLWVESVFQSAAEVLPLLVRAETEEAFYAGVAALLSAHTGLHWHRVFVYSCVGKVPGTAELVYVLGGRTDGEGQTQHRALQGAVSKDERFSKLAHLVEHRLRSPEPHHVGPDGLELRDGLYDLCIAQPQEGAGAPPDAAGGPKQRKPIVEHYGKDLPLEVAEEGQDEDPLNYVRYALSLDYRQATDIPILFNRDRRTPSKWVRVMNEQYPGMFAPEVPVYAFPLWCPYHQTPQPLGVVLVDMQHHNDLQIKDMCSATKSLLALVSDVYALRTLQRRVRGRHKLLHEVFHERTLGVIWDAVVGQSGDLVGDMKEWAAPEANLNKLWGSLLTRIQDDSNAFRKLLERLEELGKKIQGLESPAIKHVGNLGRHLHTKLEEYRNRWPNLTIIDDCDEANLVELPCDEVVLNDAIFALLQNSIEAAHNRPTKVTICVRKNPSPRMRYFESIVEIHVEDDGPGICDEDRPFVFLGGYSSSDDPNKGHGLSTVKAQLNAFSGDLELLPTTVVTSAGRTKAQFVIRFGIPRQFELQKEGPRYETVAAGRHTGDVE